MQGLITEKKVFDVHVEQGHMHNAKVVLRGEAGCSDPSMLPGDVVFVLEAKPHATFKRVHHDLIMEKVWPDRGLGCILRQVCTSRVIVRGHHGEGAHQCEVVGELKSPSLGVVEAVLRAKPHASFERVHHDLIMEKVSSDWGWGLFWGSVGLTG